VTRDVRIDIDEIVIDGVDVGDVGAFRAALVAELTGLASGHRGDYPSGRAYELRGSPVESSPSERLGASVARSAWSSMIPSQGTSTSGTGAGS
jgi:hypothetical protein